MKTDSAAYGDMAYKLKAITLLHMLGYNSDAAASELGAELLFAVGGILEGVPVEELDLRVISKPRLLAEMYAS